MANSKNVSMREAAAATRAASRAFGAAVALALCAALAGCEALGVWGRLPWAGDESAASGSGVEVALSAGEVAYTAWDAQAYPQYVREVGPAVVDVSIPAGQVWYAPLDLLGRARRAAGTVTADMMREGIARERGDLRDVEPSGWGHNAECEIALPEGRSYHGYFWNRSHLVAKSLGGSDEACNLVCGTRTQNVGANDGEGGMAYVEGLARRWLERNPEGTVFYSATPAYEGRELVCRSVIVDVRSSDGALDVRFEVYNAALGHEIDYATGKFW